MLRCAESLVTVAYTIEIIRHFSFFLDTWSLLSYTARDFQVSARTGIVDLNIFA
jgi:hypothetical protein